MSTTSKTPTDFPVGTVVTAVVGPTRLTRTGTVTGHEGQFVFFDADLGNGKRKTIKVRPGSITG